MKVLYGEYKEQLAVPTVLLPGPSLKKKDKIIKLSSPILDLVFFQKIIKDKDLKTLAQKEGINLKNPSYAQIRDIVKRFSKSSIKESSIRKKTDMVFGKLYRKVLRKFGYQCLNCKTSKLLQIHHADFDHENMTERNLVVLCNRCHMDLHGISYARKRSRKISIKLSGKRFMVLEERGLASEDAILQLIDLALGLQTQ